MRIKIYFLVIFMTIFYHKALSQDISQDRNLLTIKELFNSKKTKLYYTNDGIDLVSLVIDTTKQDTYAIYRYNDGYRYKDIRFYNLKNDIWKEIESDSLLEIDYPIDVKTDMLSFYSCDSSMLIYYLQDYLSNKCTAFFIKENTLIRVVKNTSMIICFKENFYYDFQYCGCGGKCYKSTLYQLEESIFKPLYTLEFGCNSYINIENISEQQIIKLNYKKEEYISNSELIHSIWNKVLAGKIE